MARVVVIGGGLAGCAAAARLAKTGHEVTLIEALNRLGGAVGQVEQDGFTWDSGPHATALPAVLRDLFRKTGRPLEREADLVPLPLLREHRFADGTVLALPGGSRGAQLDAVDDAFGAGTGQQWVNHVHGFVDAWEALRHDWLERPFHPEVAGPATQRLLRDRRSLHRLVTRRFQDERLRTLAVHHAVQGGHDPRNVPWWFGMVDYLEQSFGTWSLPGGLGRLAALLEKRLTERRVTVLTGITALDIDMGSSGPTAVRTTAAAVPADRVVVAVDPRRLPTLARYVRRTMPALPPTVVHLALTRDVVTIPHELVLHGDQLTLTVHTGGRAPEGATAWTVWGRGRLAEDPLTAMARLGVDVRDAVLTRVDRSPRDLVTLWSGSPAGVLWQGRATLRHRVGTTTPLPGVHAVGAHTGGGGWLPFVGLSAAQAADLIGPA